MLLPIDAYQDLFVATVSENQVTILTGETGSGKTTRLPVFLWQAGLGRNGIIGVTQPRRLAVISVTNFIASQQGVKLGREIGYQVRFDNTTRFDTEIKLMTDGILLQEFQHDPLLSKYAVIMIDEAHERSQNIDFLLGLLKALLQKRDDLKVVVSSATMDAAKFSRYFGNAPVIEVPGRLYDVPVIWSEKDYRSQELIDTAADTVRRIHQAGKPGDVLVFLSGADEINRLLEALNEMKLENLVALPAHGGLSPEEQQRIFQNYGSKRKVICATNIAETSLTVDGVVYVIDSGLIKQGRFDTYSGIGCLDVVHHSQAGCEQRRGRAGRTQPGVCYRLFTKEDFALREAYTEPEIRRSSLASVVLAMESLGIEDVENFDFVDPPSSKAFHNAYRTLVSLGAILKGRAGLTAIGERLAQLPLEPRIGRMLLEAETHGCVQEIAVIAAMLSVKNIFCRPKDKKDEASDAHSAFRDENSDALTLLNVWWRYEAQGFDRQWCFDNFLNARALWEAKNIYEQLLQILRQQGITLSSSSDRNAIRRCVVAGLFGNLLNLAERHSFAMVLNGGLTDVFIHPGSVLFSLGHPRWLVATEIVETKKRYATGCTIVEMEWLAEFAPDLFQATPWHLESCPPGKDYAVAARLLLKWSPYLRQFERVDREEKRVKLEEAKEIQQAAIADAEASGWQIGLAWRDTSSFQRYVSLNHQVVRVDLSPTCHPDDRSTLYYCELKAGIGGVRVDTKFPVFEFFKEGGELVARPAALLSEAAAVLPGRNERSVQLPKAAQPPKAPKPAPAPVSIADARSALAEHFRR